MSRGIGLLRSGRGRLPALPALLAGLLAGAVPAQGQSLREIVELALVHDAAVAAAQAGLEAARLEAVSTARGQLPSFSLGAGYQYTSATAELDLPILPAPVSLVRQHSLDLYSGLRWPAFTGFAQKANAQLKRLGGEMARSARDSARNQAALRAVTAFRQAQAARLQIQSIESGKRRAQLQIDQTSALERQGMAQRVDLLALQLAALDFDQKLIVARAALEDALQRLQTLTGRPIEVPPAPDSTPRPEAPKLELESLEQVKALALQRSVLQAGLRLAASRHYPALTLSGAVHYGIPGVNPVENQWMLYATAGAALSWSYNWGADTLAVRAAERRLLRQAAEERSAREQLQLEYDSLVRDWEATREELGVLAASLELARARMAIVSSQQAQGMASSTDFNDANLRLTQAELQYRSQLLSLRLKANLLEAMSGQPIGQWSIEQ
jgi:outer membrane protein TolC